MSSNDDNLLDQLIADTQADIDAPLAPTPRPQPDIDPRLLEPPAETRPRRWAHDPDVAAGGQLAGLRAGGRFEMRECGEELDGPWHVVRFDQRHPDPNQRFVFAERPSGGPPYIKMSELDFLDEIHHKRIVISG